MLHICSLGKHKTFLYYDPTWSGGHKFDCWNSILPNIRSFEKSFFLLIPSIKGTVFAVKMLFEKPKFCRIDKLPFRISTLQGFYRWWVNPSPPPDIGEGHICSSDPLGLYTFQERKGLGEKEGYWITKLSLSCPLLVMLLIFMVSRYGN